MSKVELFSLYWILKLPYGRPTQSPSGGEMQPREHTEAFFIHLSTNKLAYEGKLQLTNEQMMGLFGRIVISVANFHF